jgi:circadian clock protein KaiC
MEGSARPPASRLATGVPSLDVILGGGLPAGRTYLVSGLPGSGKTTLGNQLAFHHASAGGHVGVATLLAESHDVMLANLKGFAFFDPALVGTRVHYLNLFDALEEEGLTGVVTAVRRVARETDATLVIVDDGRAIDDVAASPLARRRFVQQLHAQATVLGTTTVLLTGHTRDDLGTLGALVDGIVVLANDSTDVR